MSSGVYWLCGKHGRFIFQVRLSQPAATPKLNTHPETHLARLALLVLLSKACANGTRANRATPTCQQKSESFIRSHCCADGMKQRLQQSAVCRQAARERLPRGRSPRRSPDTATVSTTESTRTLPESFLHSYLCSTTCLQKPCRELRIDANSSDAFEPRISSCISRRHLHRFAAEEQPANHCTNAASFGDAELQAQSCHSSLACGTGVAGTTTGTKGGSYRAC